MNRYLLAEVTITVAKQRKDTCILDWTINQPINLEKQQATSETKVHQTMAMVVYTHY